MAKLHIDLQEGFQKDAVIIRANGVELYRRDDLNSAAAVSHADSFETEWNAWPVRIEIEVTTRQISGSVELEGPGYVGISIHPHRKLTYRISPEPFLYF